MHRGKKRWLMALIAVVAMLAAACGGGDEEDPVAQDPETDAETTEETGSEPAPSGSEAATGGAGSAEGIYSYHIVEPETLLPSDSSESEGIAVLRTLFTGLINYEFEDASPVNAHAESIESEDFQTWTITLKDGWTFHDGTPVTAQSYVDAWNYTALVTNAQGNSGFFDNVEGFESVNPPAPEDAPSDAELPAPEAETMTGLAVVDDLTFTVTLNEPFSQYPITLGYPAFAPLPEVFFEDPAAFNEAPVGNGPYMMEGTWEHDVQISVRTFPDYQGENKPVNGGVDFRIIQDLNTAYNELLAGNLDIMGELPPERITEAEAEFGENFGSVPTSSYNYIGFPTYVAPYDNATLRQALSLAIDREAITETIFQGAREPAFGFISPVVPGARDGMGCTEFTEYDPERAAQLFEEAGGLELIQQPMTIWFNSGGGHEEWVQAVANFWRDNLGITEFEFQSLEFSEYLPLGDNQGFTGPFRLGWGFDYPSPQNYLEPLYGTGAFPPGGSNATFYSNPEFDAAVAEGNQQPTLEEAIPFYQEAEDILCQDMPSAPMFFGQAQFAHNDTVANVGVDAFTNINYEDIEVVSE